MKLKTVIALCGGGFKGKTCSLNILAELLEQKYKFELLKSSLDEPAYKNDKTIDCNYLFFDDVKNRDIVITTGGDTDEVIDSNHVFLKNSVREGKEVVWITATKGRASYSVDKVDHYINEDNSVGYWIQKPYLWLADEEHQLDNRLIEITNRDAAKLIAETYFLI